ncbi:hypothetical protein EJB05_20107, partial [Eragrostis curvula]
MSPGGDQSAVLEQGLYGDAHVEEIPASQRSAQLRIRGILLPSAKTRARYGGIIPRWAGGLRPWSGPRISNFYRPAACLSSLVSRSGMARSSCASSPASVSLVPFLFERAWGYDRLFTFDVDCYPETHAYIQEFYKRNCNATPSVTAAALLCLKMEDDLKYEWLRLGIDVNPDELALSKAIHEHALSLLNYKDDSLSATSSYAAVCIAKEAELAIEWLRQGHNVDHQRVLELTTSIRHHALDLITGEVESGPIVNMMIRCALVGITKESEFLCKLVKERYDRPFSPNEIAQCREIREFALDVMMHRLDEYAASASSAAEKSEETYHVWKRSLITIIERGDPTWGNDGKENSEAWNDDSEMKLVDRWRVKGSHKRKV